MPFDPEPDNIRRAIRQKIETIGALYTLGTHTEGRPPGHSVGFSGQIDLLGIENAFGSVAPLKDVSQHVVQSPWVRRQLTYWLDPRTAVLIEPCKPRSVCPTFSTEELTGTTRLAGVLPFRFGGQANDGALLDAEPLTKGHGIMPRHVHYWKRFPARFIAPNAGTLEVIFVRLLSSIIP